ncbi:hypothetical protein HDU83_009594, partial [Entophlyctis luteolus]
MKKRGSATAADVNADAADGDVQQALSSHTRMSRIVNTNNSSARRGSQTVVAPAAAVDEETPEPPEDTEAAETDAQPLAQPPPQNQQQKLVVEFVADEEEQQELEDEEEAERILCGESAETVTAINVSHPFGLKLWKPALYKKNRTVNLLTESALHEDPDDPLIKPIARFLNLGNLLWLAVFGWWIFLVYLAIAFIMSPFAAVGFAGLNFLCIWNNSTGGRRITIFQLRHYVETKSFLREHTKLFRYLAVMLFELERSWEYILLATNFAQYMLYPFGKVVIKKKHPTRHFIVVPQVQNVGPEAAPLLDPSSTSIPVRDSDVESDFDVASVMWNGQDSDTDDSEASDSDREDNIGDA